MDTINNSTIAAIATPSGTGGIGIIRISGPESFQIIKKIFRQKTPKPIRLTKIHSHKIYYGEIVDPDSYSTVDEVLMFVMKSPASYTREDVVEIQAHGGQLVLKAILKIILKSGGELAGPGEFTKRAFINGRIDLTQAESVIDIINSKTKSSLEMAISQLKGGIRDIVINARNVLITILTELEAQIDFPDEVDDDINYINLKNSIESNVENKLKNLLLNYEDFHLIRDGYKIVIIGAPNVGKSSIMNCLLDKEKSIVTHIPGTTRDIVDDYFTINGIPLIISDTAGIHETKDPVESIGIKKATQYIEEADIVLFVIDATKGITEHELSIHKKINNKDFFIIINKMDLIAEKHNLDLTIFINTKKSLEISAKKKLGIDKLKDEIGGFFIKSNVNLKDTTVPNLRQRSELIQTLKRIDSAKSALCNNEPYELVAIDIKESIECLGKIIGETAVFDILDNIFNNFCIGK